MRRSISVRIAFDASQSDSATDCPRHTGHLIDCSSDSARCAAVGVASLRVPANSAVASTIAISA